MLRNEASLKSSLTRLYFASFATYNPTPNLNLPKQGYKKALSSTYSILFLNIFNLIRREQRTSISVYPKDVPKKTFVVVGEREKGRKGKI